MPRLRTVRDRLPRAGDSPHASGFSYLTTLPGQALGFITGLSVDELWDAENYRAWIAGSE
jgi:hypothetical protein